MSSYLRLRKVEFTGPDKSATIEFSNGVNIICGASDTGKSFVADTIDFMLGGSTLREIPQRVRYGAIGLFLATNDGEEWLLERAISGGDFSITRLDKGDGVEKIKLRQRHAHGRIDNLSGFLLEKIQLLGKRILKSSIQGTTVSLSFRNLARLIIVQEGEIQQPGSPFWGGQYTLKTAELSTVKLLLTGVDDSAVISPSAAPEADGSKQIELIDELLVDLLDDVADQGQVEEELLEQLERLEESIKFERESLIVVQRALSDRITSRRKAFADRTAIEDRLEEIGELVERFNLLKEHYEIDKERLTAIQESGSMFAHIDKVRCPLCGAEPHEQHMSEDCDGDVDAIVLAAGAELDKIARLTVELVETVKDQKKEVIVLSESLSIKIQEYEQLNLEIQETISPHVGEVRAEFSELIEERASIHKATDLFKRIRKLEDRKQSLIEEDGTPITNSKIAVGLPAAVSHALSMQIETILRAWNFPGECHVHFDNESSDFVIDGKPRGSRGKGLRAITHAAVTLALLEYCQQHSLPHPGFIVLDSPLLAYFKPEGDDDKLLQGTDLKERFYNYLIEHHGKASQIIIIENQHPPDAIESSISLTVFTGNPSDGRFGLL